MGNTIDSKNFEENERNEKNKHSLQKTVDNFYEILNIISLKWLNDAKEQLRKSEQNTQ